MHPPTYLAAAACIALLQACAPAPSLPPVRFVPHQAAYAREATSPQPIIERALVIYDDDVQSLAATKPLLLGWMETRSEEAAVLRAARYGGTHVLYVRAATLAQRSSEACTAFRYSGTQAQPAADSECVDVYSTVPDLHYAVLRVEREQWDALPTPLAPKTSCSVVPLPKVGCRYERVDGVLGASDSWWQVCGEEREDVTSSFPDNPCLR